MLPLIQKALRNRWFVAGVHAGLWLLLYLTIDNLSGKAPDIRDAGAHKLPPQNSAPVAGLEGLFSPGSWPKSFIETNMLNPFFTRYFVPPAPPPPTTRKIEVTYQGFYQSGDGPKNTIFKLDEAFNVAPIGAKIATSLFIADATIQALTLTNLAAQTNFVPLNAKKEIIVPIK
ncbi:MAG: hypothetical protein NT154_30890 [Verrucomicrobia bacterium]|nr:hypothetical protein [Verrucomicrobiota bacterium]